MRPRLLTSPTESPWTVRSPPAMKAALAMSREDRPIAPPARRRPSGPTTTPWGLTRYTEPVAESPPLRIDIWPPVTRFRVAPWPFRIVTAPPCPMEKDRQSMTPRAVDCFTCRVAEVGFEIEPEPATKTPPVGSSGAPAARAAPESPTKTPERRSVFRAPRRKGRKGEAERTPLSRAGLQASEGASTPSPGDPETSTWPNTATRHSWPLLRWGLPPAGL